jgi:iron-sulfur cluster repair protein YtfE (RIC family)
MAVLPVPEVVKEMASRLEGISRNLNSHSKQMDQIQVNMLTTEHVKALEGKLTTMEAAFRAMQSEIRALMGALEKR